MYKNWLNFIGSDVKMAPLAGLTQNSHLSGDQSTGEMLNHSEGKKLRTVDHRLPLGFFS